MTIHKRIPLFAAGLLLCVGGVHWALSRTAPVERKAPGDSTPATGPAAHGFAGSASCSSRGCHGGDEPNKSAIAQQNEYTFMVMHDKHAQAHAVLLSDRAKKMAQNLAPTNENRQPIPADRDPRCLACHATPESALYAKSTDVATLNWQKGGVSCEACHGPASKPGNSWLAKHTSPKEWREDKSIDKSKYGFVNLADPITQAQICAGCHVGAPAVPNKLPARDCNHDIMAAGHPRLTFELTAFRQNMPPHWNISKKKQTEPPDYEANLWFAGRVASAQASLELLIARARHARTDGDRNGPWPEFAEYRCYACHTDLNPDWREVKPNDYSRPRGTLPYDSWYSTLLSSSNKELSEGYKKLMLEMARPMPRTDDVISTAEGLIKQLRDLKVKDPLAGVEKLPRTWEEAMQLVLAVAALKKDADGVALKTLMDTLAFPNKDDGPKDEQWKGEGPKGYYDPAAQATRDRKTKIQDAFKKLFPK